MCSKSPIRQRYRFSTIMQDKTKSNRCGVASVEFALVAPFFILLVIGCIELGRGLMVQQILTNASREGVRNAVTLSGTQSSAVTAATNFANNATVNGVSVAVTPNPNNASAGDMISLTVTVPYSNVSWVPSPWFLGSTTLSATSVMRKEGFE